VYRMETVLWPDKFGFEVDSMVSRTYVPRSSKPLFLHPLLTPNVRDIACRCGPGSRNDVIDGVCTTPFLNVRVGVLSVRCWMLWAAFRARGS
jgi:hypothetical protein